MSMTRLARPFGARSRQIYDHNAEPRATSRREGDLVKMRPALQQHAHAGQRKSEREAGDGAYLG